MAAKVAAARARRGAHLFIIARTDAAASEGIDGAVARAKLYLEAGADAIFPEALTNAEMFRAFAKAHARREAAGQHDRVRPHAVLHRRRVRGDGLPDGDLAGLGRCASPTRRRRSCTPRSGATAARRTWSTACRPAPELYETIGYHDYEALDASIVQTVVPQGMPQRE